MHVPPMLNIGCGAAYHPDWINLDVAPSNADVLPVDISKGLPFDSNFAAVCYSSHVLEHLDKAGAAYLIAECFRVLKPGGVIRLAVPDLEVLARQYISLLEAVEAGDHKRELDYDWIMLELYDQTVRSSSGGGMARFLENLDEKDRDYVRSRIGVEAEGFWNHRQPQSGVKDFVNSVTWGKLLNFLRMQWAGCFVYLIAGKAAFRNFQIGNFRGGGEVHQWMYDRYSLKRLFVQAGFVDVKVCSAYESQIPEYEKYSLDVLNGMVRKPDSVYIEASKP